MARGCAQLCSGGPARGLAILLLLAMCVALAGAEQPGGEVAQSRFVGTAVAAGDGAVDARADFAGIALARLGLAHAYEAESARAEADTADERAKLLGWAAAVDRFASDLARLGEAVADGNEPLIGLTGLGEVTVSVNDRLVILTHPRADQQSTLEQEILGEFCSRHRCDAAEMPTVSPVAVMTAAVRPRWEFNADGAVCSHDGVSLHFHAGGRVSDQRRVCAALMEEISSLADEIRWQIRHAVRVDWSELAVFETPAGPGHRVQLNRAGDSVLVRAPLLASSAGLLSAVSGWLRQTLAPGEPTVELVLDARLYGLTGDTPGPGATRETF